jgi:hypothetical protein
MDTKEGVELNAFNHFKVPTYIRQIIKMGLRISNLVYVVDWKNDE